MSIWRELFKAGPSGLDRIRDRLLDMLDTDRRTFDLACAALLDRADVDALGGQVRDSDHQVNQLVQQVRRELVTHASAHGAAVEVPALLLYMSIVKDIERIGDYAKNILDIARAGGDLSGEADRRPRAAHRLPRRRLRAHQRGPRGVRRPRRRPGHRAADPLGHGGRELDARVDALIPVDVPARHAVPRALYYRHLKRVVGHLMNILTALVMPLDKLDFFSQQDQQDSDS